MFAGLDARFYFVIQVGSVTLKLHGKTTPLPEGRLLERAFLLYSLSFDICKDVSRLHSLTFNTEPRDVRVTRDKIYLA